MIDATPSAPPAVTKPLSVVYFGTSAFAVPPLQALRSRPDLFRIAAVVTKPDQPVGRAQTLTPAPVAKAARAAGLPVLTPTKLKSEDVIKELAALNADVFAVAAYGKILPPAVLDLPRLGCFNLHGSLLPRYRGASPIQAAIANGETETGVTLMGMDAEMDHGPIYSLSSVPIAADDTYATLEEKLARTAAALLVADLPRAVTGQLPPQEQPHEMATYTAIVHKEDGQANWREDAAALIANKARAYDPWPGLFTVWMRNGRPLRLVLKRLAPVAAPAGIPPGTVWRLPDGTPAVVAKQDAVKILELRLEGKKTVSGPAFLNGYGDLVGASLLSPETAKA